MSRTVLMKRNIDDVIAAIGAAMAETQGRTLEQIDHAADAATAAARKLLAITLQDYTPYPGADPGDAEWRYRKELERVLGGAGQTILAFRAWSRACESAAEELTITERTLAEAWVNATARARAEGMAGLADSHSAWFEVRSVRPDPPSRLGQAAEPVQRDLF